MSTNHILLFLLSVCTGLTGARLFDQSIYQGNTLTTPCFLLNRTFPEQVVFRGEYGFTSGQSRYWSSQQSDLEPACRFLPKKATDIQEALADIILPRNVSIAVVSGGHSSVVGASNIDDGITIDLSNLGGAMVVEKGREVLVGPAARWEDVYYVAETENVTVAGGRVGSVGAAGLALGGGLSWFSGTHGWTSDNVIEFEVVTPMAEILNVNNHTYQDLFWALKGSAGSLGIVTRMTMSTIPNKGVYGGSIAYDQREIPQVCDALEQLSTKAVEDPATQGYLSMGWVEATRNFTYTAYFVNTENNTKSLGSFQGIDHAHSSFRPMTMKESANEIGGSNPADMRRSKFTVTGRPTAKAMLAIIEVVRQEVANIKFDAGGLLGVNLQPITVPHLQASRENLFGLEPADGPLLLISAEFWWTESKHDEYFKTTAKHLRDLVETELKKLSASHPWIYPNYAAKDQNPFTALTNPRTKAMLGKITQKYDPKRLWKKHVPGIWHL